MNDRQKELLVKGSIVTAASSGLLFIPILPVVACLLGKEFEEWESLWISSFVLFILTGISMMIFMVVFKFKPKPVKAEKLPLPFDNFNLFFDNLGKSVTNRGYQQQPILMIAEKGEITVYTRPKRLFILDCIAVVRVAELNEDILIMANDKITESITNYYKHSTARITDTVSMISVVCVDRITPTFQKLVNSNIQQGFKNLRLPVGISFGGKFIYIAKQKGGFAITQYKKLRNEFLSIMGIQINPTT